MANNQTILPHTSAEMFLTDGGLETTMIFLEGHELPCFAAFDLLKDEKGCNAINDYFRSYLNIATDYNTGFIMESPTWRANPDWIEKVGYPKSAIKKLNEDGIALLVALKKEYQHKIDNIIISGCIGPRGDGYKPENLMTVEEAQHYHSTQVEIFSTQAVDIITGMTMNYAEEAIGIALAAGSVNLPVVISLTVETDGKLPTGMSLKEAIEFIDKSTPQPPIYFMINCAHPTHFSNELEMNKNQDWTKRIRGIKANASCMSHAELDESTELDRGNPHQFGSEHKSLKTSFNQLNIFGGCCGTDVEHISAIAKQVLSA